MKNELEYYRDVETNERYYVVDGELTAIDAILLVAKKTHTSKDRIYETKGYVHGVDREELDVLGAKEKVPDDAEIVWILGKRKVKRKENT